MPDDQDTQGELRLLEDLTWEGVRSLGMAEWLWLDMVDEGIHIGETLPATPPNQLSHIWGWAPRRCVRIRADKDIPGGLCGSELLLGIGTDAVVRRQVSLWAEGDGRAAISNPRVRQRLTGGCVQYDVAITSSANQESETWLTFMTVGGTT